MAMVVADRWAEPCGPLGDIALEDGVRPWGEGRGGSEQKSPAPHGGCAERSKDASRTRSAWRTAPWNWDPSVRFRRSNVISTRRRQADRNSNGWCIDASRRRLSDPL